MQHRNTHLGKAAVILASCLWLAACQSGPESAAPAQAAPGQPVSPVTPAGFRLPAGEGCAGEVSRFKAVMDNDLATGHTTRPVHERVTAEIAQADATCKGGNSAGAIGQIRATKQKFGYR